MTEDMSWRETEALPAVDAPRDPQAVRDVLAVVLLVVGVLGLGTVAFVRDPLLGAAFVFSVLIVAGLALGIRLNR